MSDIKKALKENGFKLVSSNRHFLYRNDKGVEVRLHLGSRYSDGFLRKMLGHIRNGSSASGKAPKAAPAGEWKKMHPKVYAYCSGDTRIGRCEQGPSGLWRSLMGDWHFCSADLGEFKNLAEAKAAVEKEAPCA